MHKIVGYFFIFIGMLLVFFALIGMYKAFADHQPVPQVVQLTDMNIRTQYGNMLVPMQNINQLANIGLFVLLMMFVLSAGAKVGTIGCNLLKNERIYEALSQLKNPTMEELKKL
ncbi:MAG: hypothetical protein IKP06_01010 [Elusimicrobiaceae bacterium]|nr:hypothetical protein [Elusimicrobiaceae bacterium]